MGRLRSKHRLALETGSLVVAAEIRADCDTRPSCRAEHECRRAPGAPWSAYLTGLEGRAPSPFYDPLEFAVTEAHARGLELHAWFNPYRAKHPSAKSPHARSHFSITHPELVRTYGSYEWMDPGEPAVIAQTLRVMLDVVRRYDVDGIHIDDYFYPYPEAGKDGVPIPFPDSSSYAAYQKKGGKLERDDWRRHNVDTLIQQIYVKTKALKPWVKVGISPFGIWRPGNPAQIRGLDAYDDIYADSRSRLPLITDRVQPVPGFAKLLYGRSPEPIGTGPSQIGLHAAALPALAPKPAPATL